MTRADLMGLAITLIARLVTGAQGHWRGCPPKGQPVQHRHARDAPGHLAAERVAADDEALHLQRVEHVDHEARVFVAAVGLAGVLAGEGAGEAEGRQVQRDDAAARPDRLDPAFPGVQAGRGAVQQHHRQRVFARAFVAQVHHLALDVDEVRRRRRPARHQRLDGAVGRAHQRHRQRGQHQQHADDADQHAGHGQGAKSTKATRRL